MDILNLFFLLIYFVFKFLLACSHILVDNFYVPIILCSYAHKIILICNLIGHILVHFLVSFYDLINFGSYPLKTI